MAVSLLGGIGVLQLCSAPDRQLLRLEVLARSVQSRAQMIPLVELALFAIELGDYEGAKRSEHGAVLR